MNHTTSAYKKATPLLWGSDRAKTDAQATETEITGPHFAADGADHYRYWRCEDCGNETTDVTITRDGCWECGHGR